MATIGGTLVIRSGPDYGPWRRGPYGVVVHCLQCPGTVNVASLAGKGSYTQNQGVSPHTMADRRQIVEILGPDRSGAHVGAAGNPFLWGSEVTGYAEWTSAQWAANSAALLQQARAIGRFWAYKGWSASHLRWGSLAELAEARRRYLAGLPPVAPRMWIHWDVSRAIGSTSHWDVGKGYPFADMERWAREWVTGAGASGSGSIPDPGGTPTGVAGAETTVEDDEMLLVRDIKTGAIYGVAPGVFRHIATVEEINAGYAAGLWREPRSINEREIDLVRAAVLDTVPASTDERLR